jgi:plastocyanin
MCAIWQNFLKKVKKNMRKILGMILVLPLILMASNTFAAEKEFLVQIKDHKFEPAQIEVPANEKFKLIVENLDATLEEFESNDLKKEKLISGGKKVSIIISPLKSGEYKFFGDFHQKTAQGKIVVK